MATKPTPETIKESQLRSLVRTEIAKIIREDEKQSFPPSKEAPPAKSEDPNLSKNPDTKAKVSKEPSKEEDPKKNRGEVLDKITHAFTKALKGSLQDLSTEELADSIDSLLTQFGLGRDSKMEVLKAVRSRFQA